MNFNVTLPRTGLLLLCGVLWLAASPANARNEAFLQPISKVLQKSNVRAIVGDMTLLFGAASAQGADIVSGDVTVEGIGDASVENATRRDAVRPTDEEVCDRAFQDAVAKLVTQARQAGAVAIVGIVSDYKGQVRDDAHAFECHAGAFRSVVALKAQLSRSEAHSHPVPAASGFAAASDVQALPATEAARERYAHFLTLPKPRAFALYEDGSWRFYSKDPEAMTKALDYCARQGRRCWLYAVDDRVVWTADVTTRIGSSAQLGAGSTASTAPQDDHQ
jgi:hypothetical protein